MMIETAKEEIVDEMHHFGEKDRRDYLPSPYFGNI
jgi:hypothetical protein